MSLSPQGVFSPHLTRHERSVPIVDLSSGVPSWHKDHKNSSSKKQRAQGFLSHFSLWPREGVKKLSPLQRTGRDVGPAREAKAQWAESFQSFTAVPLHVNNWRWKTLMHVEYLQTSVSFTLSNDRICKTLEISLPARLPEFFHSFRVIPRWRAFLLPSHHPHFWAKLPIWWLQNTGGSLWNEWASRSLKGI